jgi:hypothetical protein
MAFPPAGTQPSASIAGATQSSWAAHLSLLALLAAAGCGGGGSSGAPQEPSLTVHGVDVVLETGAAFAAAPDFPSRLESTMAAALGYWGGSWSSLDGMRITLVDDPTVPCHGKDALGCFDGEIRLTTRDPSIGTFACVEETVLVHELGHAVIGDPDHTDPRWMEMDAVATELSGRQGYTSAGDVPCTTYVSVWRHPLGTP